MAGPNETGSLCLSPISPCQYDGIQSSLLCLCGDGDCGRCLPRAPDGYVPDADDPMGELLLMGEGVPLFQRVTDIIEELNRIHDRS